MPFKLPRLKKSKHYNVVSKTLFVICVELLDSTTIDCTLSSESLGQECRDNVCQKLGLQQPELFGLRFATKTADMHPSQRWAELSRPLKRQLDKYAQDTSCLQLRVMYYVSGLNLLTDEITRYHYFLQLKIDVIEGRVSCSPKQAALLASYSMQAEFGDYEPGKHTAQYLKDFALFPAHLAQQGLMETLTEAAILQHGSLRGLAQSIAEEYYILAAQQLDGYGQQTFIAKDEQGNEVVLAMCLTGLSVAQNKGHYYRTYRWENIANVVNVKRGLTIEGQGNRETTQLSFASTDLAKYVWRLCLHQHTFFVQNEQPAMAAPPQWYPPHYQHVIAAVNEEELMAATHRPGMHTHISSSVPELLYTTPDCSSLGRRPPAMFDRAHSNREICTSQNEKRRACLPQYRPAPDYETAVQQKYQQVAALGESGYQQLLYSSQPEIPSSSMQEATNPAFQHSYYTEDTGSAIHGHFVTGNGMQAIHTYSSPDLQAISDNQQIISGLRLLQLFKQPPPYASISSSTPDLANVLAHQNPPINNPLAAHVSGSSPDLLNSRLSRPVLSQVCQDNRRDYARTLAEHQGHSAGNMLYYHPHLHPHMLHHMSQQNQTSEPIYENFPLRYSEENLAMRARASSIQSAPENLPQSHEFQDTASAIIPQRPSQAPSPSIAGIQHLPPVPPGGHSQSNTATKQRRKMWSTLLGSKSSSKDLKSSKTNLVEKKPAELSIATKDSLCQRLEKKLTGSQLFLEFEHIPRRKEGEPCMCALSPENLSRNRYKDVICYDYNRVQLTPRKDNRQGYINASHVVLGNGPSERSYIAAQAPTQETFDAYWQMIWETGTHVVISLAARHEENHCPGPPDNGSAIYGDMQVQSRFTQETGHCITSQLHLLHRPTKSARSLWLLRYCEWGDQGFLEELNSVRQHAQIDSTGPPWPVIVHCLAGAGRTGLLIMADVVKAELENNQKHLDSPPWPVIVHCLAGAGRTGLLIMADVVKAELENNQDLDLSGMLLQLRCQRMLAVQTILQYRFIHSLVVHYLRNTRLI